MTSSRPKSPTEGLTKEFASLNISSKSLSTMSSNEQSRTAKDDLATSVDLYYGDRHKCKIFLGQIKMAYVLNPSKYSTEVTKNIFAISKMRGAAFAWAEPYLTQYMDGKMDDDTKRLMGSFNRFEAEFRKVFSSNDEGRTAARQIHQIRQKGSVTAYYSTFRQVSAKLEWDPKALASAFYQGLSDAVKDKLDNPSEDLHTLVDDAIDIDNRLYERKMEKAGRYGAGLRGNKTYGDPMELDAMDAGSSRPRGKPFRKNDIGGKERERRRRDRLCYNCGKSGHQAKECKLRTQELHMMNDSAGTMEQKADTVVEPLNNKESSAQKEPKDEVQVHEDKKASGKDAAKQRDASQLEHATLSWTGCYDDSCPIHRSDKEGSGWFPPGQKEKRRSKKPSWWNSPSPGRKRHGVHPDDECSGKPDEL